MEKLLEELDLGWYGKLGGVVAGLPLERLWGIAIRKRNERLRGQLSNEELRGIVADAIDRCIARFHEHHPPKSGCPNRRSIEDRFVSFFAWKLTLMLADRAAWLKQYRRGRKRRRRKDVASSDAALRRAVVMRIVHRAIDQLAPSEQEIVTLRFWEDKSFREIAHTLGLRNVSKAQREVTRVLRKLRPILVAYLDDEATLGPAWWEGEHDSLRKNVRKTESCAVHTVQNKGWRNEDEPTRVSLTKQRSPRVNSNVLPVRQAG